MSCKNAQNNIKYTSKCFDKKESSMQNFFNKYLLKILN